MSSASQQEPQLRWADEAAVQLGPSQPFSLTARSDFVVATAVRAPSVHNTQPWKFRVLDAMVELYADGSRRLARVDPDGREMLISCGAALFGLRLAVRCLGYRPIVELLPERSRPDLLARVHLGGPASPGPTGGRLLAGLRRRHTHRGAFSGEPLPAGLFPALQRDAEVEAATLVLVQTPARFGQLASLVALAETRQHNHPLSAGELRAWTRPLGSPARDGVPARAFSAALDSRPGTLAQRDFDLGRGCGSLAAGGAAASAVTAVLTTVGDTPVDWLRAGQALHRLLLTAAGRWVFARLHTQPLEIAPLRSALRARLRLPGQPQMVLQLGLAHVAPVTARRPITEVLLP